MLEPQTGEQLLPVIVVDGLALATEVMVAARGLRFELVLNELASRNKK